MAAQEEIESLVKPLQIEFKIESAHVRYLNLGVTGLKSLPESIGNLRSLKELYLFDSFFTSLPESIGNLQSLQKLEL